MLTAELDGLEASGEYQYGDDLIGQALVHLWRGEEEDMERLLQFAMERYDIGSTNNHVIHYAGCQAASEPVLAMALGMGDRLLAMRPYDRWTLLFQAHGLVTAGKNAAARGLFERSLELPNRDRDLPDWQRNDAEQMLQDLPQTR
ncbi:MAG: hypothetical protein O7E52_27420 [Candidatus Poribacteria bacterium]|nr:hypothetical protein [Candidatus Poribacteria bacterium]